MVISVITQSGYGGCGDACAALEAATTAFLPNYVLVSLSEHKQSLQAASRVSRRGRSSRTSPSSGPGVAFRWVWFLAQGSLLKNKTTCWTRRHWRLKTGKLQVAWTYSENCCFYFIILLCSLFTILERLKESGVEHLSDPGKCHVFQMNLRCVFYGRYQLSYNICLLKNHILINGSSLFNQSHLTT